MSRTVQVFQVDAFTTRRFTGNPAGVVLHADVLSDDEMLAIARELNNADTAFVLKPDTDDHDLRVRFFTPRTEAAFVGHATVAAHHVLSRREGTARQLRQKQRSGMVDIAIRGEGPERFVAIRQSPPPLGREINVRERLAVLDALALSSNDLDTRCPMQIVGSSSTRLLIGVRSAEQLRQLKPDMTRLNTLSAQIGAAGHFVFALTRTAETLTTSRMFCPALGIPEDPVSGNAHGMLGCYLAQHRLIEPSSDGTRFSGAQGQWLNRPGRVDIELEFDGGTVAAVWIVGQAVLVFETTLTL